MDAGGRVPWWGANGEVTLHTILIHVIAETARHGGHADIVREELDGAAGLRHGTSNLPERDPQWWADYVAKLQRTAAQADHSRSLAAVQKP